MTEKAADDKANPIILAILFAGILAALVFILMTGDDRKSEVPEENTEITPVEIEMVPAPEPEPLAEEVVVVEEEVLPEPTVSEETADAYARETIESVNGGKALAQFVAGDYIVERAVRLLMRSEGVKCPTSYCLLAVPQSPSRSATTDSE